MRATLMLACVFVAALGVCGCVERQMTLVTDPPGARAYYNGTYVGRTPVTFHFTHYQDPDVRFELDGHKTLRVVPKVKAPWYQLLPVDFFAETMPFEVQDTRTMKFALEEAPKADVDALLERADRMRLENAPKP